MSRPPTLSPPLIAKVLASRRSQRNGRRYISPQGGASTPFSIVQPTRIHNVLIKR
jgi:hypothetical protein